MSIARPPSTRASLWAGALTAALLAVGFRTRRSDRGFHTRDDEGRGRLASSPSEIPARGWKDILWRVYENINNHRIMAVAAGVTFYVLLALFPGIAALVSLYGLFADPTTISQHLSDLSGFMPEGATQVIGDQLNHLAANRSSTLGLTFLITLVVSLWSANSGMKAMFDALKREKQLQRMRNTIKALIDELSVFENKESASSDADKDGSSTSTEKAVRREPRASRQKSRLIRKGAPTIQ